MSGNTKLVHSVCVYLKWLYSTLPQKSSNRPFAGERNHTIPTLLCVRHSVFSLHTRCWDMTLLDFAKCKQPNWPLQKNTITYHNALCSSPPKFKKALFSVSLGAILPPKRNWRQCLCKMLGWQTKTIMVVMIFSGVVNKHWTLNSLLLGLLQK